MVPAKAPKRRPRTREGDIDISLVYSTCAQGHRHNVLCTDGNIICKHGREHLHEDNNNKLLMS